MIEKPQMIKESQNAHTQSSVRSAMGCATSVPKNDASLLIESCKPIAMASDCVRNHFESKDSCIVTIRPLPIPKITRPTTINGKDVYFAARAVSKLPMMTNRLTTKVPQTEPNMSIKKPPAMGKIVLIMETDDDSTP